MEISKTYFKRVLSFQFSILFNSLAGQNVKLLFLYAPDALTSAWCVLNSASLVIQLAATCVKFAEHLYFLNIYIYICEHSFILSALEKDQPLNALLGRNTPETCLTAPAQTQCYHDVFRQNLSHLEGSVLLG